MLSKKILRNLKTLRRNFKFFSTIPEKTSSESPTLHQGIQFSKEKLIDFGELPVGEIPEQLKVSPKCLQTNLSNQVRITSEQYKGELTCVSLFVNAGSRWETLETSGSARMLTNLFLRGTKNKSRKQIEQCLKNLGAQFEVTCERELIGVTLKINKKDIDAAVELACEMVLETNFNEKQFEAEKENVLTLASEVSREQNKFSLEGLFYTSFREHMLGQPVYGNKDLINQMTMQQVQEHRERTFTGSNFDLVITGDIQHHQVVENAKKYLDKVPEHTVSQIPENVETPYLTPTMMS